MRFTRAVNHKGISTWFFIVAFFTYFCHILKIFLAVNHKEVCTGDIVKNINIFPFLKVFCHFSWIFPKKNIKISNFSRKSRLSFSAKFGWRRLSRAASDPRVAQRRQAQNTRKPVSRYTCNFLYRMPNLETTRRLRGY